MRSGVVGLAVIGLFWALACSAFAGDVARFYKPMPSVGQMATIPPTGDVQFYPGSGKIAEDVKAMQIEGRQLIGYSTFLGRGASPSEVTHFAKSVGAGYVIIQSQYVNTITTGNFGSTTFNRFGAFSFSFPTNVDRFEQGYFFFGDTPKIGLGVGGGPIPPDEAKRLGTAKGFKVSVVRRGSPAFMADILPDDIVTSIDGVIVYDIETLRAALLPVYGKTVEVKILRDGKELVKAIPLPVDGKW